jgi:hypothetical protein
VAAIALAFGLSFGLGGRDVAARITQDWYEGMSSATEKVMEVANTPDATTTTSRPPRSSTTSGTSNTSGTSGASGPDRGSEPA